MIWVIIRTGFAVTAFIHSPLRNHSGFPQCQKSHINEIPNAKDVYTITIAQAILNLREKWKRSQYRARKLALTE
jgi:hypothetical protein